MQIQTILNQVEKHKSFVYGKAELVEVEGRLALEIKVRARANSQPVCGRCGKAAPGYDRSKPRRFLYMPIWGVLCYLMYEMRRVDCRGCGVVTEAVPWAEGKERITRSYRWFLAAWAKRLSWSEVAEVFHVSWHQVYQSVAMAVAWGLAHRPLGGITAIGIDELQWGQGHQYVTVVYQLNEGCKRLLWVGPKRSAQTLLDFFQWLGPRRSARLQFICSDMWKPYLQVIAQKAAQAIHILDRFHILVHFNQAIDRVRNLEAKTMKQAGLEPVLKKSRWCLLKRPENLTEKQEVRLADLLRYNLKTVRSYLLKEDFQNFWDYVSPFWAGQFLDRWCTRALRSRIEPIKEVASMLRRHRELLLNWFRARKQFSSGVVEGLNNKAKLTTKKAYGFSTYKMLELALYHTLGDLPEPKFTHKFF